MGHTTRMIAGFVLALLIGAGCRLAGVALPAPPTLTGALLLVAITLGYLAADRAARRGAPAPRRPGA